MSQFQSKKIVEVLRMIQDYDLVLPAFQREYVWKPEQVERLFDSLMKGYPINSMLFWKVGKGIKQNYRFYKMLDLYIEDNRTHNDLFDTKLKDTFHAIIDGQQRITSLNLGLRGSYAYRKKYAWARLSENNYPTRHLYLNLSERLTEDEGGMTYDFEWVDQKQSMQQDMYIDAKGHKWFRVGKVLDFADKMVERAFYREHEMTLEEESVLARLNDMVFHDESINYYEVDSDEPDVAVDVFVRTNSGGTTLNYADILLSITIANWEQHNRDARTEIYGLIDRVNKMGFNITHDYVLKAFLYLFGRDAKMRITSFNNALLDEIAQKWEQVSGAVLSLFALLKGYGLDGGRLTSNYATLPVLLYLYRRRIWGDIIGGVAHRNDRAIIKRWLMKTLLLRTFGYRSDGSLRKSRHVLNEMDWQEFPAGKIESTIGQTVTDDEFFQTILTYRKDNRYTWIILSLLYQNLVYENVAYHADHMHSAKECQEKGLNSEIWDSVLNLQLLPQSENESKGAMPLKDWVDRQTQNKDRYTYLESRLIPDMDLKIENFDAFIATRKEMLISKLKELF
jgi:hypothetical protein